MKRMIISGLILMVIGTTIKCLAEGQLAWAGSAVIAGTGLALVVLGLRY